MNFKVGDWVVEKSDNTLKQIKLGVNEDEQRKLALYGRLCVKWEPKVGEWCWFKTDKSFKLVKYDTPTFNQAYYHGLNPIVEPFIGTLPSFIKETK